MINNRKDIKEFIIKIEQHFPVNNWKVNTIHIWPILRIKLFLFLINEIELKKKYNPNTFLKKRNTISFKKKLKNTYYYIVCYLKWKKELPKKDFVFLANDSHRVEYKKKRYNRFFDVLIEKFRIKEKSLFFEYDSLQKKKQYNEEIVYKFDKALESFIFFFKPKIHFEDKEYDEFLQFLKLNNQTEKFAQTISKDQIKNWAKDFFIPKYHFFKRIFNKVNPKKILILCYYNKDILPLLAAANSLKIETIEMQHGPQSDIHLAYSNWTRMPKDGYEVLPKNFWCWDDFSKKSIDLWAKNNNLYKAKVVGNPWLSFWKEKQKNFPYSNYILYSLQPAPLTLDQLFPDNIIRFIKEEKYIWFIRLHPRQLNQLETINDFLKEKGIRNKINLNQATNNYLPQLLLHSRLHVTHFSGTTIEAALLGVFSILLNETAVDSFPELISEKKAVYLDCKRKDFQKELSVILNNVYTFKPTSSFSFDKKLFD